MSRSVFTEFLFRLSGILFPIFGKTIIRYAIGFLVDGDIPANIESILEQEQGREQPGDAPVSIPEWMNTEEVHYHTGREE